MPNRKRRGLGYHPCYSLPESPPSESFSWLLRLQETEPFTHSPWAHLPSRERHQQEERPRLPVSVAGSSGRCCGPSWLQLLPVNHPLPPARAGFQEHHFLPRPLQAPKWYRLPAVPVPIPPSLAALSPAHSSLNSSTFFIASVLDLSFSEILFPLGTLPDLEMHLCE